MLSPLTLHYLLILEEAEIVKTAQALEALQSLKGVLNHPAYSGTEICLLLPLSLLHTLIRPPLSFHYLQQPALFRWLVSNVTNDLVLFRLRYMYEYM